MPRRDHGHKPLVLVEGVVDVVRFHSAESGYTVLVTTIDGDEQILVGERDTPVEKGAKFTAHGRWTVHRKHGRQFRFETLEVEAPTGTDQIIARLKTYPGIGPATAERIVEQFGERTWEVMDDDIDVLRHIPGVGRKFSDIKDHHQRQHGPLAKIRNRLIEVAPEHRGLAKAIHEEYGEFGVMMLDNHPYTVAQKVSRFGFGIAQRFARATGLAPETAERVDAGIVHVLRSLRSDGHCCLPEGELVDRSAKVLSVSSRVVAAGVQRLLDQDTVVETFDMFFLRGVDRLEGRVATSVEELCRPVRVVWDVGDLDSRLSAGQRAAVESVARSGVTVLTGGPGTGKSEVVSTILGVAERSGVSVIMCAPTGRAARRLAEATGRPSSEVSTIHRLLRPIPGTRDFYHNAANRLPPGLVVVDEASMLDLELADALLSALTRDHRLLLVGDADQLPSVGAGDVLRDFIDAAEGGANISVVRLHEVFRQARGSSITANAHRLLRSEALVSDDKSLGSAGQFYIIPVDSPERAQGKILRMAAYRVPDAYGLDPVKEVQILCPMHPGPVGTEVFNAKLQRAYGKDREAFYGAKGRRFCVGDRVIQLRNDYERNVFNGDLGTVTRFDETFVTVDFDGAEKRYKRFDAAALQLAFAMTIHKSQGGEFPAVLIPVFKSRMMTSRLLYTAITRAQELCVVAGRLEDIRAAVQTRSKKRWTRLSQRLTGEIS